MAEIVYMVEQKANESPQRYGSANKAYAQAFSLFCMAYSVGSIFGPICAGLVRDTAGWITMGWVLDLISGVTTVPTGLLCGRWILKRDVKWR